MKIYSIEYYLRQRIYGDLTYYDIEGDFIMVLRDSTQEHTDIWLILR
jgi:hypothetical protein